MMTFAVLGQDIRHLELALLEDGQLREHTALDMDAERYLEAIAMTLASWKIEPSAIGEVIVVTGPGAFTASRLSTTIANGFAFATGAKLRALANEAKCPLTELVASGELARAGEVRYAEPTYDRPPNITIPKHHA